MVDVTLKEGIEKTLMEKVPNIKGVKDVTDHSDDENAYYKQFCIINVIVLVSFC